jgi:transketolase
MRNAFMATLFELAEADKNIMLLTGDLGFGVFEEFQQKFPKQFLNVGVAEQNMMGVASGLALEGKIIFTYSIGNFPTLRCLEQIRNDACYHELNINIIAVGGGFSYGGLGMSHHATEDVAIMRALPKTTVIAPSTTWEAGEATRLLAKTAGVGYLRIDKSAATENENAPPFQIGKARRLREGSDITIFGYGGILQEAMLAADKLSNLGISCRVSSLHTIKPIDVDEIISACKETQGIITIEEHIINGGLGGAVAEVCMDKGLKTNFFVRMGMQDEYSAIVGDQQYLRRYYNIDALSIMDSIKELLGKL